MNEVCNEAAPAGLVGGPQTFTCIAMIKFIEWDQIDEVGIFCEGAIFADDWANAAGVFFKKGDHPLFQVADDLFDRYRLFATHANLEIGIENFGEGFE